MWTKNIFLTSFTAMSHDNLQKNAIAALEIGRLQVDGS